MPKIYHLAFIQNIWRTCERLKRVLVTSRPGIFPKIHNANHRQIVELELWINDDI